MVGSATSRAGASAVPARFDSWLAVVWQHVRAGPGLAGPGLAGPVINAWMPTTPAKQRSAIDAAPITPDDFRIGKLIFAVAVPRIEAVADRNLYRIGICTGSEFVQDRRLCRMGNFLGNFAYHGMTSCVTAAKVRSRNGNDRAPGCDARRVRLYGQQTGRAHRPGWHYYSVSIRLRIAAPLQGIGWRATHGTALSGEWKKTGRLAMPVAQAHERQVATMQ